MPAVAAASPARPEVVAEISGNHEGSLARALTLIDLAAANGADAVKIQTYTADSITVPSTRPEFAAPGLWRGRTLYDLYREAGSPREWMAPLFDHARQAGIKLFSTPLSPEDVDALERVGCPRYKIGSFEINYPELLQCCASTGKPVILSSGVATLAELDRAVACVRAHGCADLTVLLCQSAYPADPETFNLRAMAFFKQRYDCKSGLSDHALSGAADVAAAALGADLIEKHFTDARARGSVDAAFSLEPQELRALRRDTAIAAAALGSADAWQCRPPAAGRALRRSAYLVRPLAAGQSLTPADVRVIRPGAGLDPFALASLWGRPARRPLAAPQPLRAEDFT